MFRREGIPKVFPSRIGLRFSAFGDYAARNYFESIDRQQNHEFVRKVRSKFGSIAVTDAMEAAYFAVQLWAKAVKEADSDEVGLIRARLRNQSLEAAHGKMRIDAESQHTWKTARIGQINSDGRFEVIWES